MSKMENIENARVLRDDELDAVGGGAARSFAIDIGTSERVTRPVVALVEAMPCC